MTFEGKYGRASTDELLLDVHDMTDILYSNSVAQSLQERHNTNIPWETPSNQLPYSNPSIVSPRVPSKTPGLISELHDNIQSPTTSQYTLSLIHI